MIILPWLGFWDFICDSTLPAWKLFHDEVRRTLILLNQHLPGYKIPYTYIHTYLHTHTLLHNTCMHAYILTYIHTHIYNYIYLVYIMICSTLSHLFIFVAMKFMNWNIYWSLPKYDRENTSNYMLLSMKAVNLILITPFLSFSVKCSKKL
jgi:hypothetical protein